MAYQSLYRRYRPQRFGEVWGQEHLVQALRNAVREDRVGHAYLFSGPRGTGKTTSARILAKALNCPDVIDGEPCGVCESCTTIAEGSSFDVFELDAASNNGVDAIRDLTERANQASPGRRKVYILDEVHMLSGAASNALLKTLEEPPEHVVFVLATTDPQKVLPTIKSRTQHFEVHLLSAAELEAGIAGVIADAALEVSPEALDHVLRAGGGSARDTLSALERVVAFGGAPSSDDVVDEIVAALGQQSPGGALAAVERGITAGRAPRTLGEELMARLRDVFLASVGADLGRISDRDLVQVRAHAEVLGPRGSTHALEVLGLAFQGIREAPDPRIPLEVALLRLTRSDLDTSPSALLERIERLERQIAAGVAAAPPGGAAPAVETAPTAPTRPRAASGGAPPSTAAGPAPTGSSGAPRVEEATRREGAPNPEPPAPQGGHADGAGEARRILAAKRKAPAATTTRRPPRAPAGGTPRAGSPGTAADGPGDRSGANHPQGAPSTGTAAAGVEGGASSSAGAAAPTAMSDEASGGAAPDAPAGPATAAAASTQPPDAAPPTDAGAAGGSPVTLGRAAAEEIWQQVLPSLPKTARVRYAGGHIVSADEGGITFGLPNDVHRKRCDELRGVVEEHLAAAVGATVPLHLVVDAAELPPRSASARPAPAPEDQPTAEEDVDISTLVDAPDTAANDVERIAEVFPGAQLIDEEPRP